MADQVSAEPPSGDTEHPDPDFDACRCTVCEQFHRAYDSEEEWLAYCAASGVCPGAGFEKAEPEPEPTTGLGRVRAAIRRARGGDAPVQPRGPDGTFEYAHPAGEAIDKAH